MNIVIPMAGLGSRFKDYDLPKPLIPFLNGKTIIESVLDGLPLEGQYIFIIQEQHKNKYGLDELLFSLRPNCQIICIDGITSGQLSTILLAEPFIDNDESLLVSNCDIKLKYPEYIKRWTETDADGFISVTITNNPAYSYAKVNEMGLVVETAEKKVISSYGSIGIFWWKRGSDLVKYGKQMLQDDSWKVNNEFYLCPCFNLAIRDEKKFLINHSAVEFFSLGTPSEVIESIWKYIE